MNFVQFTLFSCILFSFVSQGFSAVAIFPNTEDPAKPGYCKFEYDETSIYIKLNHSRKHPKDCVLLQCNAGFTLDYTGCAKPGKTNHHCRAIPGDVSKPFPQCCIDFVC